MPLYEFKCKKCGNRYEIIKGFKEDADHDICPKCKGEADRIFSGAPAVEYHGAGYYCTDHAHSQSKGDK